MEVLVGGRGMEHLLRILSRQPLASVAWRRKSLRPPWGLLLPQLAFELGAPHALHPAPLSFPSPSFQVQDGGAVW